MIRPFSFADIDGHALRSAAAHLHKPTVFKCREREGSFRDVEAWLAVEPSGLWGAVLQPHSDVFGVAFEDTDDAEHFKRRWAAAIEIVEHEPGWLLAH